MNNPPGDDDIADLLPWYVNGTLDLELQDRVDEYLARSPAARAEELWLRQVRAKLKDAAPARPHDAGLDRLSAMIRAERTGKLVNLATLASLTWPPKR